MTRLSGAVLALLLGGCGAGDPVAAPSAPPASASGFPRTIDVPGSGALTLAAPPQRVVVSASGLGDLVCELLPPERLAGLPDQMRDYSGHRTAGDPWLARPTFHVFAAEPVLALQPDLVIADRWSELEARQRLVAAGVPLLTIAGLESLDDVRSTWRLLARVVGEEPRGEALVAALDARIDALSAAPGARAGLRALAYTNGGTGGWVAGAQTTADVWIALAGLVNAVGDRAGHVRYSFEELLVLDPDVIIVPGEEDPNELGGTSRLLLEEPALAALSARRRGLVVALPSWLVSTNSQHLVTAAEELARRLDAGLAAAPP